MAVQISTTGQQIAKTLGEQSLTAEPLAVDSFMLDPLGPDLFAYAPLDNGDPDSIDHHSFRNMSPKQFDQLRYKPVGSMLNRRPCSGRP